MDIVYWIKTGENLSPKFNPVKIAFPKCGGAIILIN